MADKFVTKPLTRDLWLKEYAPTYKRDKDYPESAQMCLMCKHHHEELGKMWPPCGNKELNRELQFETLKESGVLDEMSQEELFQVQKEMDPVIWAITEFEFNGRPWIPRWYQEFSLRCSSTNKSLMWGRRAGKSETQIVECLWYARYRKGASGPDDRYAIHVFANSERLVTDHWDKFKNFIESGRELASMWDGGRMGKTIKLKNNVIIHFHVLSMKVIGLDAYYMWFDEAAFYFENEKALPHALAIRHSRPDMPVTMTSNSSGFRGRFYEYCHNKDTLYLNLPSYVNPTWDAKMEMDARQNYTSNDYSLLFKAEWGESERAVFSPRDIQKCLEQYEYSFADVPKRKPEGAYRCLGCDWNEGMNGVHFVVVEYDPNTPPYNKPLYTVINKTVVSGEQWNHEAAEQKAWELLVRYQCDSAYLDYGGGGSRSVDYLKRRCIEGNRYLLARNIVEVNMASMEDVPDSVFPGLYTKKRMKNLIVNQCQISLQRHQFRFPYEENEEMYEIHKKENIIPQMRAFAVEKVDTRGFAIYSKDLEEHTLTAWMLAVWGCKVNCTDDLYGTPFAEVGMVHSSYDAIRSEYEDEEPDPGSDVKPGPAKDVANREPKQGKDPMVYRGRAPGWMKKGFSRTRGFGDFRRM